MGATNKSALRVTFDSRVKLEFHGSRVTSDAGLLAYRELDEALELTARSGGLLDDWRTGKNAQHSLVALLRQSIFSRLAGYEEPCPLRSKKQLPISSQLASRLIPSEWTTNAETF